MSFQSRVDPWVQQCFGPEIAADTVERNHRFLEESLELVQSLGCTASEARQLVDYVFSRPLGEPEQEVGGVAVTLAALCNANRIVLRYCAETELARIWTKVEKIRAKQKAKPKHSPLPLSGKDATTLLLKHAEIQSDGWVADVLRTVQPPFARGYLSAVVGRLNENWDCRAEDFRCELLDACEHDIWEESE